VRGDDGGGGDDDDDDDGQNEKTMILNFNFHNKWCNNPHLIIDINICDEVVD